MDCDAFRDEMMDLLYGEAAPAAARRLDEHQAACRACRDELSSFRRLRRDLASWRTPPDLGRGPRRFPSSRPYLAMAAALLLLVTGGLAVRGSELRYEQGRFAFRLGRAPEPSAFSAALAAQEERHRREIDALRAAVAAASSEEATLRKVQRMLEESEARQAAVVSAGLTRLEQRTEARRQYDLAQVGAGLSYLDGKAGLQAARTTELMGHVLQASQKK
jgi:anti-sigma factor RsiW